MESQKITHVGRPGYRVTKQFDRNNNQRSLLFQIYYPVIESSTRPQYRLMSTFEQRKEPTNRKYQYVIFAADSYEIIAFKVPCNEIISSKQLNEEHINSMQ